MGPFPNEYSCTYDERIILKNGGYASCRSGWKLEFDTREDDVLWADFLSPAAAWTRICAPHRASS